MQKHRDRSRLRGCGVRAVIFARQLLEAEFAVADRLPQERGSSSAASFWPSARIAPAAGEAKRSSTAPDLILSRLPDAASTCSDASLSARTDPAFS